MSAETEVVLIMSEGKIVERTSFEEYAARGRVPDCDCQLIQCACTEARKHAKDCRYRVALTCAVAISCDDHGRDVCPQCDPCTCSKP